MRVLVPVHQQAAPKPARAASDFWCLAMTIEPRAHGGWRMASLTLGAMSVLVPAAFFTYVRVEFLHPDPSRDAEFCGMPLLGAIMLCFAVCSALSLFAGITGILSYLQLTAPRPLPRRLELIAVGSPAMVMLVIALAVAVLE